MYNPIRSPSLASEQASEQARILVSFGQKKRAEH